VPNWNDMLCSVLVSASVQKFATREGQAQYCTAMQHKDMEHVKGCHRGAPWVPFVRQTDVRQNSILP
jgi:hypothetical protein